MKKIISFSLWGRNPLYLRGAIENVYLQQEFFNDWICRFYVDDSVPSEIINELKRNNCEIVYKSKSKKLIGLMWRFEVAFDDIDVERYIVRDADSRLTLREKVCVDEWISSGLAFHIIRDHPNHTHPIMGGMWGGIPSALPEFKRLYKWYNLWSNGKFWTDMTFLKKRIWPRIQNNHLAHDEFHKFTLKEVPFTIKRTDNFDFVGNKFDENNNPVYQIETSI